MPNDGVVTISPTQLKINAAANSNPTLTLLTTEAPSFTQTFQADVAAAYGDAYPAEIRLWNPNQNVAAELWFYQGTVYGGLLRSKHWLSVTQIGSFAVNQPLQLSIERRPCDATLSVTEATGVVHALSASCSNFPELFHQDTLSVTVSSMANVGAASILVLSTPHLMVEHQTLYGYPSNDPRLVWVALLTLALACATAGPSAARFLRQRMEGIRWPGRQRLTVNFTLYFALVLALIVGVARLGGHPYDAYSQGAWTYIAEHYGASNFYTVGLTTAEGQAHGGDPYQTLGFPYPPLLIIFYQVIGRLCALLAPGFSAFDSRVDVIIKAAHILFLTLGGLAITLLVPRARKRYLAMPLLALSAALVIDAAIWGQLDAELVVLLAVGSLALFRGWFGTGLALLVIASLTKQTALLFAPWAVLIAARMYSAKALVRAAPRALAVAAIPLCILFAAGLHPASTWVPSIHKALQWSTAAYREEATALVTNDAYGLWPLLTGLTGHTGISRMTVPDVSPVVGTGMSYLTLSHVMAALTGMLLLAFVLWTPKRRWAAFSDLPFLALAAAGLIEPLLLTRMNGRYFLPGLVFLLVAIAFRPTPWLLLAGVALDAILGFQFLGLLTDIAREHPTLVPRLDPTANGLLRGIWSVRHNDAAITALSGLVCIVVLSVAITFVRRALGARSFNLSKAANLSRATLAIPRFALAVRTGPLALLLITVMSMWLLNGSVVRAIGSGEFSLTGGFYPSENINESLPAWTGGHGVVELNFKPNADRASVTMDLVQPHFDSLQSTLQMKVLFDSTEIPERLWRVNEVSSDRYQITVPVSSHAEEMHRLELISPTFIPKDHQPGNDDKRQLGVQLRAISATSGLQNLRLVRMRLAPTLTGHDPEPLRPILGDGGRSSDFAGDGFSNGDFRLWGSADSSSHGRTPLGWINSSTGTSPDLTRTNPATSGGAVLEVHRSVRVAAPDWEEASVSRGVPLQQCDSLEVGVTSWPNFQTSDGASPLVAGGIQVFSEAAPERTIWVVLGENSRRYTLSPRTSIWEVQPSGGGEVTIDLHEAASLLGAPAAQALDVKIFLAVHQQAPGDYQMNVRSIGCQRQ